MVKRKRKYNLDAPTTGHIVALLLDKCTWAARTLIMLTNQTCPWGLRWKVRKTQWKLSSGAYVQHE